MTIKELRTVIKMSQREFASFFGIPLGTLRNWEQGIAKPPEYVFDMIMTSMRRDKMINIETIRFVKMLDELAELSANGIADFEEATEETNHTMIFYDGSAPDEEGNYPVAWGTFLIDDIEGYHHDIVSYYGSDSDEYSVRVVQDQEEDGYMSVLVKMSYSDEQIVVENGRWYFV